jgi:DNA modification methylase
VAQIAASIKEFGFTNPILVDENNGIIAGHGRLAAANLLGLQEVPTIELAHLSPAQRKAYILADNKLALNAGWDIETLKAELEGLQELDFDLSLTGFDSGELAGLMDTHGGLTDPDEVPPLPEHPIAVLGDVWTLGRHRLVCGDSTDADVVAKCLNGVEPHLMVTDPPYGVEYDANWRNEAMPQKNDPTRWKDGSGSPTGAVMNDDKADWSEAWALFPGDVAYVWHAGNKGHIVAESLIQTGLEIRAQVIWAKSQHVIGRGHYHPQHEPCWYAVRKKQGATGHWQGDRKQSTIWNIDKPRKSETGHSTQKPVECMKRPIENNSSPGQAVYEPFSGSGTTIIAAEMTGRCCYAIELSPAYIDVAVKRWEDFTGEKAVCNGE